MFRRIVTVAAAIAVVVSTVAACADDDATDEVLIALPAVAQIFPAVEAVEAEVGPTAEFFEINTDARLVNLFVATDGGATATAYVFLDGELQPPAPPRDVESGNVFTADAIDVDPDAVFDRIADELPGSNIVRFVIVGGPGGVTQNEAIVQSPQGGVLAVVLAADGAVLAVEPL